MTSRVQVKIPASGLHAARSIELTDGLEIPDAIGFLRQLDTEGRLGLRTASDDTLGRVQELTRGIPRALEFIAGILSENPTLSVDELVGREDLFGEEVVERLVAAGYHHLEENAQRVMQALSVYDRPVGATEVMHLLHPWLPGIDVQSCLRRLARSYFVYATRGRNEYSLHPLDQRYAYQQIPEEAKADEDLADYSLRDLHRRAADFYRSVRQPESLWKTIDDIAPLLSEFRHDMLAGDYNSAAQILTSLDFDGANCLNIWGYTELLAELRGQLVGKISNPRLSVANLGNLGFAYRLLGRYDQARDMLEQAAFAAYEVGDRNEIGVRLGHLGVIYRVTGQIDRAIDLCRQAADIAKETGQYGMESNWLGHLATAYRSAGKFPVAIDLYEEALNIAKQHGDRQRTTFWLTHLGITYSSMGQYETAIAHLQQAFDLATEIGSKRHQAICLDNIANTHILMGQHEKAVELLNAALLISRQIGVLLSESYHLLRLARAKLGLGDLDHAKLYASQSLALNLPETNHQAATVLGIVLLRLDDPAASSQFAAAVKLCREQLGKSSHLWEVRLSLGTALVGLSILDAKWKDTAERPRLLQPAINEYGLALQ
ncbi:MAG: tetratricopeptide repeat protein, partial [Chloroflexi bacterium]|nr:tetratricopeptide repeat protein [Chloroflexota bacterium]